ncbi:VOC family protein [Tautonia plasticadhaerens]|uniref:VOC domain-containing protein n=1 Tax=Tautonia plasticadhaerens TaxID=2527974 RepID=A0A518H2M2_9BACT|nr:VOC family protein [Tautonia plasticadhaerens]QDV35102.1 hypothetical protein ElP_30040 [Tautonia plasticadhaerens]
MASVEKAGRAGTTITPYLTVRGAERAVAFYREAFGAEEAYRMAAPGGTLLHAEVRIGEASFYLSDEFPDMGAHSPEALGGSPVVIHLSIADVDATFARAVAAGATPTMPPADMFWGDRFAKIKDPFGHCWSLASPIEEVGQEEAQARADRVFAAQPCEN